jgi:VanZ family protein
MKNLANTDLFRVAGWLGVALIAILSLIPGEARPHAISSSQLEHVLAYALTAAMLTFGYFSRRHVVRTAILLPIYAALLEVLQVWVPGRMSRLPDVAAGALGTWLGVGVILLLHWIIAIPKSERSTSCMGVEPRTRPPGAE